MDRIPDRFDLIRVPLIVLAMLASLATTAPCGESRAESLPQLVLVKAGTRIGDAPPMGWSDLILKTLPRLESGDLDTLPSFASSTATLFRSVILADIRPTAATGSPYALKRVGLALCVLSDGLDVVVSEQNVATHPIPFGMVETQVLSRAADELKKARLIARTETFAVLAAPSSLKVGRVHKDVYLIYALIVDPRTGRLDTLLWAVSLRPERRTPPGSLTLLPPRLLFRCGLDVEAERLLGTIPINWSFAMGSLPAGRKFNNPEPLRLWTGDPHRIASDPEAFEQTLRASIPFDPPPPAASP